jgi:hypothetical protein
MTQGDSTIMYTMSRPLDCNLANSYVIPLDTEFSLIWARKLDTIEVDYHDNHYNGTW